VSTDPFAQLTPPKRNFAHTDKAYVAMTATWMLRIAHPARSEVARSPRRAEPTVGRTASATRKANRSCATYPYESPIVIQSRYSAKVIHPNSRGARPVAASVAKHGTAI
jgi:hypothetical protein